METNDLNLLGRKIFFLYPHTIVKNEILQELSNLEYEAYELTDSDKAFKILGQNRNSLCFINIDTFMSVSDWLTFVQKIRTTSESSTTLIGIITNTGTQRQIEAYNDRFNPNAGIISIRSDKKSTLVEILKTLEEFKCRGRRKYVRTYCEEDKMANLNFEFYGSSLIMKIRDISSVGLCCYYPESSNVIIPTNTKIENAQVTLRGFRILCNIVVFAVNKGDGPSTYVFLFTKDLSSDSREKIRKYVQQNLQAKIMAEAE